MAGFSSGDAHCGLQCSLESDARVFEEVVEEGANISSYGGCVGVGRF